MYVEDLTQKVAGERMGVSQQAVELMTNTATESIGAVYEMWAWMGGDLTIETEAI